MGTYTLEICYLIASICYIVGLKMMAGPKTARNGNLLAAGGMTLAIFATIFLYQYEIDNESKNLGNYIWVFGGIIVGTIAGWLAAKKVQMTAMPQMVSLFNGMGGACAALIALVEFPDALEHMHEHWDVLFMSTILCGLVIGSTSFSGSMIAYLKLNGNLKKDIRLPFYNIINTILIVGIIGLTICLAGGHIPDVNEFTFWAWILLAGATIYGIMFVLPIGGADMPVVISLLNSFTGMAAMFGGFLEGFWRAYNRTKSCTSKNAILRGSKFRCPEPQNWCRIPKIKKFKKIKFSPMCPRISQQPFMYHHAGLIKLH